MMTMMKKSWPEKVEETTTTKEEGVNDEVNNGGIVNFQLSTILDFLFSSLFCID